MPALDLDITATHEVFNQVPPLVGHNAYDADQPLREAVARGDASWAGADLRALGALVASEPVQEWARLANAHPPVLRTHDRWGHRVDAVEFHPSYHELMRLAFGAGVHSYAWKHPRAGAQVARAALSYLWNQAENGVGCPTAMAFAAIPVLRWTPDIGSVWTEAVNATDYDPRPIAITEKTSATIGMTFTEKQGGSDLRANTTSARGWEMPADRAPLTP